MLRWNGLHIERRKMCPNNRKLSLRQHSTVSTAYLTSPGRWMGRISTGI